MLGHAEMTQDPGVFIALEPAFLTTSLESYEGLQYASRARKKSILE